MLKRIFELKFLSVSLLALWLSGCGGGTDVASCSEGQAIAPGGQSCVTANIPTPPAPDPEPEPEPEPEPPTSELPDPVVTAAENEAVLFYNRPDGDYEGWVLHLWNNETCPDTVVNPTEWPDGPSVAGIDPNYGGYYVVPLLDGHSDCMNFIVHDPDGNKDLSDQDRLMDLSGNRMAWTLSGVPDVFTEAVLGAEGVQLEGMAAHWVTTDTLVWDIDATATSEIRLYHSLAGDMTFLPGEGISSDSFVVLTAGAASDDPAAQLIRQASWDALHLDASLDDVKSMLKSQLIAVAWDASGEIMAATRVQTAKVLDDIYTSGDADADEAELGIEYTADGIVSTVWAPTAQSVELKVYDADKTEAASIAMTENTATGVWSATVDAAMDRMFYRFAITVYHPVTGGVQNLESTDPMSISLATNGRYSQFVNLMDDDLKPAGWDSHDIPVLANPEDAVIYEGHVRDFSALDETVSEAHRGKYMAFTEKESVPMQHLQRLQEAGLTTFHILPMNDIATINEDTGMVVNVTDTVADLCTVNGNAPVCGVEDDAATILSVLQSYDPATGEAQLLVESMRGFDSFNWGYDPHHFNAPEGSYATNPEGETRILEVRAMIQSLHEIGLRVVMDNVYNHTNASGVSTNSVLDKVVPGYYHRYNQTTGNIERSTCCDNTATENRMMAKLMVDTLVDWTETYKFDGYRFDLMGHLTKDSVLEARDAVQAIDADNYFYGEGWDFGEVAGDRLFEQARQDNMAGTEVGTFNDRIREAVRGGALFNGNSDDGTLSVMDGLKVNLAGTLEDYSFVNFRGATATGSSVGAYATDPADIINYVSVHDNETLWDQFNYALPSDFTLEQRVRAQTIAFAVPMFSQGIPFFHVGVDLLRSKSMDRNTFDAGDWYNFVDFTGQSNNWNVGLPLQSENGGRWDEITGFIGDANRAPGASDIAFAHNMFKEFMSIRKDSPLFRLPTGDDIKARVGFHTVGASQTGGVIVMSIDDGIGLTDLDTANDAIVVMFNATSEEQSQTVTTATGFQLHATQMVSFDATVQTATFVEGDGAGTFTVPAQSVAVFVKPQGSAQGEGLSAFATVGEPDVAPFGDTTVYLRGAMNDWGTADVMSYEGNNEYSVSVALEAGTAYAFKVASEDWETVNLGAASTEVDVATVMENTAYTLTPGGEDMLYTPAETTTYIFSVDASDTAAPVLTVRNEEPYSGTEIYVRGSMNDWGTTNAMTYDGQGYYFAEIDLTAGDQAFKVASEDWETVNLGGDGSTYAVGESVALESPGNDVTVTVETDGTYIFSMNASDSDNPSVAVFESGMYGDTEIFIRGNYNDWGADAPMSFDGSFTYSQELQLSAGELVFKVADADWADINKGASVNGNIITFGNRLQLETNGAGDLTLEVPTDGTYLFQIKGPDSEFPSILVTPQ